MLLALEPTPRAAAASDDLAARSADYAAVERVYYEHRLGNKLPFETATIEKMVRTELKKEAVLKRVYGVGITPAMVEAEVKRIDATTRAPEMLAQIKAALGNDAARFARTVARPIIVERELRARFADDAQLHAAQRREAEQARESLRAGQPVKDTHEVTWQLTPRPAQDTPAQPAGPHGNEKVYFADLYPQLQNVLRVQLQKPGDVSAVIEMPGDFLVFIAREKSAETLSAASVSIPKRSYEAWLAQQPEEAP